MTSNIWTESECGADFWPRNWGPEARASIASWLIRHWTPLDRQTDRRMLTDDVDDLLKNQTELDDQCFGFIEYRTLESIVSTSDAEQVVQQTLLVRSLDGLYTHSGHTRRTVILSRLSQSTYEPRTTIAWTTNNIPVWFSKTQTIITASDLVSCVDLSWVGRREHSKISTLPKNRQFFVSREVLNMFRAWQMAEHWRFFVEWGRAL